MDAGFYDNGIADPDPLENNSERIVFYFNPLSREYFGTTFGERHIINGKSCDEISFNRTKLEFTIDADEGFPEDILSKVRLKGSGLRIADEGNDHEQQGTANIVRETKIFADSAHTMCLARRI
jgi:hypothetical protein